MPRNALHAILLAAALFTCGVASAQQSTSTQSSGTPQQDTAAKQAGDLMATQAEPVVDASEDGGEGNGGTVTVNGEQIDVNKLAPGVNRAKTDKLKALGDSPYSTDALRAARIEQDKEDANDTSVYGNAAQTAERSTRPALQQTKALEQDNRFWESSINAIREGQKGRAGGRDVGQCTTTTTSSQVPTSSYTTEERVCDVIKSPTGSATCTRQYEWSDTHPIVHQEQSAPLNVNGEVSGQVCRRDVQSSGPPTYVDQSKTGQLTYPNESSGEVCSRDRWAEQVVSWAAGTKTQAISVNKDVNGQACRRDRWAEINSGFIAGFHDATLSVNTEAAGKVCDRTRWPTGTSTTVTESQTSALQVNTDVSGQTLGSRWQWPSTSSVAAPGALDGVLGVDTSSSGQVCSRTVWPTSVNSSAPGTSSATLAIDTQTGGNICKRTIWPSGGTTNNNQSQTGTLSVNKEAPGNEGTLTRWPSTTTTTQGATQSAALDVNQEVTGAVSGSKWHWPTTGTAVVAQAMDGTISINTESNALMCTRKIWPTSTNTNTSGSSSGSLAIDTQTGGNICKRTIWPTGGTASQAQNTTATLAVDKEITKLEGDRTRTPANTTSTVTKTQSATLAVNQEVTGSVVGSKWHWPSQTTGTYPQSKDSALGINTEVNGTSGTRTIWPTTQTTNQPGSSTGVLNIDTQAGGNICKRTIWPTSAGSTSPGSQAGTLTIDTQANGQICTRHIDPTMPSPAGTFPGTKHVTATVNTDMSGQACTRYRWVTLSGGTGTPVTTPVFTYPKPNRFNPSATTVTDLSAYIPAGTTTLSNFQMVIDYTTGYTTEFAVIDPPTAANGWKVTVYTDGFCDVDEDPETGRPIYSCQPSQNTAHFTFNAGTGGGTKTWSVVDTGDCSKTGTTACPVTWACTKQAPTSINGISVTSAEVGALARLYTGAPAACTNGTLNQTCSSGTSSTSNTFAIARTLPPGTTSISGFTATITNPQPGITATVTQVPSAANTWKAIIRIDRTNYTYIPDPPELDLAWTATSSGGTAPGVVDSGNCTGAATANCPATWSCTNRAPWTGPDGSVTLAMASTFAPLYPGASGLDAVYCANAKRTATCSGAATTQTSISIASSLPAGTTSITGFDYTVTNPQAGALVALSTTPSAANGWVAVFTVARTTYSTQQAPPAINMTWTNVGTTTTLAVQDTGSCTGTGSTNCPATWSCTTPAPTTVNGIVVDATMAATKSPLYPGAASSCVVASNDKVCSGNATTPTTLSIASKISAGVTSISGFAFTVSNPQTGVTVSLVTAPTQANGWNATFNVVRSNWAAALVQPQINMTWSMAVPSTLVSVVDTGNTTTTGTAVCPTSWSCTQSAPATINGIAVDAAMAASKAPLYPGAANTCVTASLNAVCSGGTVTTPISIAADLTPGTTSIAGFAFTVTNPQAGVTVSLVSAPTAANSWVATFSVARSTWTAAPAAPQIHMTWTSTATAITAVQQTSGNVTDPGTAACPTQWTCTKSAPSTVNGIAVTTAMANTWPLLYTGAAYTCLSADLKRVCSGTDTQQTTVSIAASVGSATSITGFSFVVNNPQPGVAVTLVTAPTLANSWVATFAVTRSIWSGVPNPPSITLNWDQSVTATTFSVVDTGNTAATSTTACPVAWSCGTTAPATINGIAVTAAMVAAEPLLYPGAATSCLVGKLNRTCSGTSVKTTPVSIATLIPAGTQTISGFTFTVSNPQAGVAVALVTAPSLANSWVATFSVTRSTWTAVPADPQIAINWTANQPTTTLTVTDTGTCSASGTTNCPALWSCDSSAPATVNGIVVDATMAATKSPLYPGAASTCVIGSRDKVCSGTASRVSSLSIASQIPAGVTSITGFAFTVANPQAGLTVSLVTAPSQANGWLATFNVDRTNYTTTFALPQVNMTWNMAVPTVTSTVVDTGDCSATGTPTCPVSWTCSKSAPVTVNGILVDAAMAATKAPLYPSAANTCAEGTLNKVCSGGATSPTISIASQLAPGTTSIANFAFTVSNPQPGVTVALSSAPTAANSWVATFAVTRTDFSYAPVSPSLHLTWDATATSTTFTQQSSGNITDTGSTSCPTQWSCTQSAPSTVNGINVTTAMANTLPLLYPGAAYTCLKADLKRVCSGSAVVSTPVSIAANVSAGATAISNFAFTVSNPQTGVTVALATAPTQANNWVATFNVTRTIWSGVPVKPNIVMTWDQPTSTSTFTVVSAGNVTATSTSSCPVAWSCTTMAPATLNSINVTAAMVAGETPLYPGASTSCLVAALNRTCSGSAVTTSTQSIAATIPAGTQTISGFAFTVSNPQAGVAVALQTAPTLANSWVATFTVTRSSWASVPADPQINMTWTAQVPSVNLTIQDSASCTGTGTSNCPVVWTCSNSAPYTVNGISVTAAMAASKAPLYPAAPNSCVAASFDKTCSGNAVTTTDVSLATQIPAGTTAITGFTFTVSNPQPGVTVALQTAPIAGNSWTATFKVTRSNWAAALVAPQITMNWNSTVTTVSATVEDTGDCSSGDAVSGGSQSLKAAGAESMSLAAAAPSSSCPTSWSCTANAPATINGLSVDAALAASMAPLYPGAASSCVTAKLTSTCSGNGAVDTPLSIASQLAPGVTSVNNFAFTVTNPQTGVAVALVDGPTLANNWVATFRVTRTAWNTTPVAPQIHMTWDATSTSTAWTIQESGDPAATGTTACPAQWSCSQSAPATVNGVAVTAAMVQAQPLLYTGASNTCLRADLKQVCGASVAVNTDVSIAASLPAGTTAISGFTFSVLNPQPGISVQLVTVPSLATNWVATYKVTRTNWATVPAAPNVKMNWTRTSTTVSFQVIDSATCDQTATASCSTAWSCRTNAPATLNGVALTAAMVAGETPLYTGASSSCLVADLTRTCAGSTTTSNDVSIAADIPAGVTSITGVAFTVSNPQAGVTVSMSQTPSLANGWLAKFNVVRSSWASVPAAPQIHITWNQPSNTVVFSVKDTGDCSSPGTASCPTSWSCSTTAPTTINGIAVTAAMLTGETPLYASASTACTTASLNRTCSGGSAVTSTIDISDQLPAGTTTIRNFSFTVTNPQPGLVVSLVSAPTQANNWIATFSASRSDYSYAPVDPVIKVDFEVQQATVQFSIKETGDCTSTGTPHCPTSWNCKANAPTTINGIAVTPTMVQSLAALYSGAPTTCTSAGLNKTCSGTDSVTATISIADVVGSETAIRNFAWAQTNSTPGLTITLLQTPALANNWVASFKVERDYAAAAPGAAPTVKLTWRTGGADSTTLSVVDTGDCSGSGTASCPLSWTCDKSVPATINGVSVTSQMLLDAGIQLYPGDAARTCVGAKLSKACAGPGAVTTTVSIAAQLPAGTQSISNYTWSVTTPVAGVSVTQVSAPSLANNWTATFQTTRSDWLSAPAGAPQVKLSWDVQGSATRALVPVDTGDCSFLGDEFCKPKWQCTAYADSPSSGGTEQVIPGTQSVVLYPARYVNGVTRTVSIAAKIPAGTTTLRNVNYEPSVDSVSDAAMTIAPSAANNWVATFQVVGACFGSGGGGQIPLAKVADGGANAMIVQDPGDGGGGGGGTYECEPAFGVLSWDAVIPGTGGSGGGSSGGLTTADLVGVDPLYPGAPANCIAARRTLDCSAINDGKVCHDTDAGQVCDVVVGGQYDGCATLRNDPTCTYQRTVCTEDSTSSTGFCYLENEVYECRTPVDGEDTVVTETTNCPTTIPVCDTAGCGREQRDTSTGDRKSMAHSMAMLAVIENIHSDYVNTNTSSSFAAPSGGSTTLAKSSDGARAMIIADPGDCTALAGDCGGGGGGDPGGGGGGTDPGGGGGTPPGGGGGLPPLPPGWNPWTGSADPNDVASDPNAPTSYPPGFDPNKMTFFNGKSQNCMKALGGLLNCCTKKAPAEGNVEWWKIFEKKLRSGWAGVASCSADPAAPPGAWAAMGQGASNTNLNSGFTSGIENLTGGGALPTCMSPSNLRMENVQNDFMSYVRSTLMPKLAWYCDSSEKELAVQKKLGACTYLGDYCSTKVLGVCIDKRQRYCCFNSPMTKLIRDQLKKQGVIGMGTAKHPKCGGITMAQMAKLQMDDMATTSLEGSMFEAGVIPNFSSLLNGQFMDMFTGSGSYIANADRQAADTRTEDRAEGTNTEDAYSSIRTEIEGFIPETVAPATAGPGQITIANATVSVPRGHWFEVRLTRSGGQGAVSVHVTAKDGTARAGVDYSFTAQTVSWGNNDTSTRIIKVYTYAPLPAVTVNRSFEVLLDTPAGGASIYPTGRQIVTITPLQ